ncbi:MAG: fumarylacetoacetate hydrolase family protein [Pseudomonadota bacterium]|nr:fumarylacetoacetate hydrolase family protein [Pseudomonadota bacterium]
MTDTLLTEQAALWLDDMHTRLARYQPLPEKLAPDSLAAAYKVQQALVRRFRLRGLQPLGHKIALSARKMQELVNIDRPVGGAIIADRLLTSPARVKSRLYGRLGVECEVAVRLSRDLAPSDEPYTEAEIIAAVDCVSAAFEIVDDRHADYHGLSAFDLVADNAWNAGIVIGEPVQLEDWGSLSTATASLVVDGEKVGEGVGSDAMGHPFNGLLTLANELTAHGITLKQGEWVLTGAVIRTQFPDVGSELVYSHDVLGEVRATIV